MPRTLAALLVALACTSAHAGETITLVADAYCPFNCAPRSKTPGYMVEVAKRVLGAHGITVKYEVMDWEAAIAATRAGRFAGVIAAVKEEVPDLVFPATELGRTRYGFYVRKGDPWRFKGKASLAGKRIGVVAGYAYFPELDAFLAANPRAAVRAGGAEPLLANVRALLDGRLDVVVEDEVVMQYRLASLRYDTVLEQAGAESSPPGDVFVAFSPANPRSREYARLLSEGVQAMRASGELAAILARYGVSDWR